MEINLNLSNRAKLAIVNFVFFIFKYRSCSKMEVGISCKCLKVKTKLLLSCVLGKYGAKKS